MDVLKPDNPFTSLVVDLEGIHPDCAFSVVPYEKGSTFLWYLEDLVGGPGVFEQFLRDYYQHFKFQAIDSYQFKDFFLGYFKGKDLTTIDWDKWFHQPGMPPHQPNFDTSLAQVCQDLKTKWIDKDKGKGQHTFSCADLEKFSPGQKIEFLAQLLEEDPLEVSTLEKMNETYGFNASTNYEIKFRWIRLGLKCHWDDAIQRAIAFVKEQGRLKFLRPVYRDLYAWEKTRELAIKTFNEVKPNLMPMVIEATGKDLHLSC